MITSSTDRIVAHLKSKKRLGAPNRVADYPEAEKILYSKFAWRRLVLGLPADSYFLRSEFLQILNKLHPGHKFKFSKGWVFRFCLRFPITSQVSTEKKAFSVEERLEKIEKFHQIIFCIQNILPRVSDIWGAFPPDKIWNADHVPAPFCVSVKRSLNMKGAPCWIAVPGPSGLEKRQATIHICLRANGEQLPWTYIIFRGKGAIHESETQFLESLPHIKYAFQAKVSSCGLFHASISFYNILPYS